LSAQTLADFENFMLAPETFLNGDDGNGGFASGNLFLPNAYNGNYNSWSGWLISNSSDVSTSGYTNDFSCIVGEGAENTDSYAVSFVLGESIMRLTDDAMGNAVTSMHITNSTYAYLSMLDGDAFAKKFGGASGDDPDYFLLTIRKYLNGELSMDSINFYLADYRFTDNTQDYIVDEWTKIDLSSLGSADSLSFKLSSTDNGMFGMNTPAYFCADEILTTDGITSVDLTNSNEPKVSIFPNPVKSILNMRDLPAESNYRVYNSIGQLLLEKDITTTTEQIDVQKWMPGTYILEVWNDEGMERQLFIKN